MKHWEGSLMILYDLNGCCVVPNIDDMLQFICMSVLSTQTN